ncbi:t-SNARE [Lipomyces japonicus]|uniref:t-SNARE n=1 Tax=Lipomyces japonicus TaxID=56871 RepID=UPI0034CE7DE6
MFRDRTSLYYSYRQSYARHPVFGAPSYSFAAPPSSSTTTTTASSTAKAGGRRARTGAIDDDDEEDRNPLLSGETTTLAGKGMTRDGEDVTIEMDVLPPSWTDVSDEVGQILELVKEKSARLDKLHQEHVLPGFDDRTKQERIIENLTIEITQHFHECQRLIKQLDVPMNQAYLSSAQATMSKNMQISLATKVQQASTQFRKKQSQYLKTLRGNGFTSTPISATTATTATAYPDDDLDVSFSQSQIQQSATVSQSSNDVAIQQREAEITQIAQGIIEMADIFKELQTVIIDQGTLLDRIDYNIETMKVHVKAADSELRQASHYQQRTQKCKIILFLLLIILLLVVIIMIKFAGRKSSSVMAAASLPGSTSKLHTHLLV